MYENFSAMLLHIVDILTQTAFKQPQVGNYCGHFGHDYTNISVYKRLMYFPLRKYFTGTSILAEKKNMGGKNEVFR
tara:strand:+ start:566 stop:793 length:228 start_codon:yes stop_codon:yes gene_type:complete